MSKFIKHIIIISIPFITLFAFLEYALRQIPNEYTIKKKHISENGTNIETLILGSSHTLYGLNPTILENKSYNYANIAQSLYHDKELLTQAIPYLSNIKTIVLPISYPSLSYDTKTGIEKNRNYKYFHFMDIADEIIPFWDYKKYSVIFTIGFRDGLRSTLNYYFLNQKSTFIEDNGFSGLSSPEDNSFRLEKSGVYSAIGHEDHSLDFESNIQIVDEIIQIASEHNCHLFLITPPAYYSYTSRLDTNKTAKIIQVCTQFSQKNSNVEYFNFLKDPHFSAKHFYDADHLNVDGAKLFSEILKNKISFSVKQ